MAFGLTERDQENILRALREFPTIEKAIIFRSRAIGNNKKSSNVDLAIVGKDFTPPMAVRLRDLLNQELLLPHFFDVVKYESITNDDLKRHIDEHGAVYSHRTRNSRSPRTRFCICPQMQVCRRRTAVMMRPSSSPHPRQSPVFRDSWCWSAPPALPRASRKPHLQSRLCCCVWR